MKKQKNRSIVIGKSIILLCTLSLLSGCTQIPFPTQSTKENEQKEARGQVQDTNYEVPSSIPNVLVDQVGYEMKSTKIAIFRGENLESTFEVIDAENGETVYTGEIIPQGKNTELGEFTSYGAFTQLEKNGTYYIQTAIIGQSYPFIIGDNLYDELLPQMSKNIYYDRCGVEITADYAESPYLHKDCHAGPGIFTTEDGKKEELDISGGWHTGNTYSRDVAEGCTIVENLLLSYEFYPEELNDDSGIPESQNKIPDILDEIKYEIDWLLKMQNAKTGGVYGGIIDNADSTQTMADEDRTEQLVSEVSAEATASFAGVMAQFSMDYQNYDTMFAKQCLAAAEKAWKYLQQNDLEFSQAQYFAAAQLFKATSNKNYHQFVKAYANTTSENAFDENKELYGDIAYLTTTQKVETQLCRQLMDKWMDKAEAIVDESKENPYYVTGDTNEELSNDMLCLAVIDHVITNHEYVTVLESHLHYLLGRNSKGTSYIEGLGVVHPSVTDAQTEVTKQPQLTSTLLFMLGEIITEDTREFGE